MAEGKPLSHTALHCFAAVARHHGIDLSASKLVTQYVIGEEEPNDNLLLRIAQDSGFKANIVQLTWEKLFRLGAAFPVILRLNNGNSVVLGGVRGTPEQGEVVIFDPLSAQPGPLAIDRQRLTEKWQGAVLFLKAKPRLDAPVKFGLSWFATEALRQRAIFGNIIAAVIALHILSLATPIFFQIIIDKVIVHQSYTTLQVLGVGVLMALLFDSGLSYLRGILLLHATSKIDLRLGTRTFGKLITLPIDFFNRATAGVVARHMQQTEKIREFLTGKLMFTLLDASALIFLAPILLFYSVELTMVVLAITAMIALVIALVIKPFNFRLKQLYEAEGDRQAFLVEAIHGMSTIKSLSLEPTQRKVWDNRLSQAVINRFKVGRISITARAFTGFLEKLMVIAVPWFGAEMVFDNQLTVGTLVAFQMLSGRVVGPLVQIVSLVHEYQETGISLQMLGHIMNHPSEGIGSGRGLRPELKGNIEFDRMTFRYDPQATPALADITLNIPAGKVIGIVGRSGSGKSTLARLLQGMYMPSEGNIRVDGFDIRELDLAHLRVNMGVVLQENFLFRGTVRQNVSMTKSDATFEEIVAVCRLTGADEFVQRLPKGYDTVLEENASNLSGGQKQRLAIARALLARPRILIFDEATSALDPESEAIIEANLAQIAKGRTVLIISHRLSNLVDADAILVLDRGKIVAFDRHPALLQTCPIYAKLWQTQTRKMQ